MIAPPPEAHQKKSDNRSLENGNDRILSSPLDLEVALEGVLHNLTRSSPFSIFINTSPTPNRPIIMNDVNPVHELHYSEIKSRTLKLCPDDKTQGKPRRPIIIPLVIDPPVR